MRNVYLLIAVISFFIISCKKNKHDAGDFADNDVAWKKTWGTEFSDNIWSMAMGYDGSVAVLGSTAPSTDYGNDVYTWIVNFDSEGNKNWETTIDTIPGFTAIIGISDGGYVLAGAGILKLDSRGKIIWHKYVQGGTPAAIGLSVSSVATAADGGYVVGGAEFTDNIENGVNYWTVKLNGNGEKVWERTLDTAAGIFSHSYSTGVSSVAGTTDGGCIVVGSNLTETFSYFQGNSDFMIIKLDSQGEIEWKKSYGGSEQEEPVAVAVTQDGGYIVAGSAASHDGDVEGVKIGASNYYDVWVLKLTKKGEIEWQKTLGGWEDDKATSLAVAQDGGYLIGGTTSSNSGDVSGNHGYTDFWIVKLDSHGQLSWQKAFGGFNTDEGRSVAASPDGYFLTGTTWSNDGDAAGNSGLSDAFIVKITK